MSTTVSSGHSPAGSFKDPIGRVEVFEEHIERRCIPRYREQVVALLRSPLFAALVREGKILGAEWDADSGIVRQPRIPYWNYPFEWSFSMLRDAALTTLELQERALTEGYNLKDGSAYNLTVANARPLFIDLYSLEPFSGRLAWSGYDQFCREFLNPLLLHSARGLPAHSLFRGMLNGISTDHAAALLPMSLLLRRGSLTHVFLKALLERRAAASLAGATAARPDRPLPRELTVEVHRKLCRSLRRLIDSTPAPKTRSHWLSYRQTRIYSDEGVATKRSAVEQFCRNCTADSLIDYGCNDGEFSEIAAPFFKTVVATDSDHYVIDALYCRQTEGRAPRNILPLVQDLANPSPALGWNGTERTAFRDRIRAKSFLALALVHHLRFASNVPTDFILRYLRDNHSSGILEYVGLDDPMAKHLLDSRPGFDPADYSEAAFLSALERYFTISARIRVAEQRELFIVESR